jgi:hypothetical protein
MKQPRFRRTERFDSTSSTLQHFPFLSILSLRRLALKTTQDANTRVMSIHTVATISGFDYGKSSKQHVA